MMALTYIKIKESFSRDCRAIFIFRVQVHVGSGLLWKNAGPAGRFSCFQYLYNVHRRRSLIEFLFQGISLIVIWNSLTSAQTFSGSLFSSCREFIEQKDLNLLSVIQEQRTFQLFAPVLHSVRTSRPFHCSLCWEVGRKKPSNSNLVFVWVLKFWQLRNSLNWTYVLTPFLDWQVRTELMCHICGSKIIRKKDGSAQVKKTLGLSVKLNTWSERMRWRVYTLKCVNMCVRERVNKSERESDVTLMSDLGVK